MNTKTMEGLLGARINMDMVNTPFRVYKEARRRGDTAAMERAMGYVKDFNDTAGQYKVQADEGMKEDAEEAREKAKQEQAETIEKRREEREEFQKKLEESKSENKEDVTGSLGNIEIQDKVEISEDGKTALNKSFVSDDTETDVDIGRADTPATEPVFYSSAGTVDSSVKMQTSARGNQVDCSV